MKKNNFSLDEINNMTIIDYEIFYKNMVEKDGK